jgi:hypothetical protein
MCAAFALTTSVFGNTYLANLSAWITKDRLNSPDASVRDMWDKTVGTYPVYQGVLKSAYSVGAFEIPAVGLAWGQNVADRIKNGTIYGAIMDDTTIQSIIQRDGSCEMRMLVERISLSDTVFAFRRTFANSTLIRGVEMTLLNLLEDGTLQHLSDKFSARFKVSPCEFFVDDDPARSVPLAPLFGLWIIYGACVCSSMAMVIARLVYARMYPDTPSARDVVVHAKMLSAAFARICGRSRPRQKRDLSCTHPRASIDLANQRMRDRLARSQIQLSDLLNTVMDLEWHLCELKAEESESCNTSTVAINQL